MVDATSVRLDYAELKLEGEFVLARFFDKCAGRIQEAELDQFLKMLAGLDGSDLGVCVLLVEDVRGHLIESANVDIRNPHEVSLIKPDMALQLSQTVRRLQKKGHPARASGLVVWTHTFRAVQRLELRLKARTMWGHVARGVPHAIDCFRITQQILGRDPILIDEEFSFPKGFNPTVQ